MKIALTSKDFSTLCEVTAAAVPGWPEFAIHQSYLWPDFWKVSHIETGASIPGLVGKTKDEAVGKAIAFLEALSLAEYKRGVAKVKRKIAAAKRKAAKDPGGVAMTAAAGKAAKRTVEDAATEIVQAIIHDLISMRPLLAEAWHRMSEDHREMVRQKWIDIAIRGGGPRK